jgi:hypothetical protein
VRRAASPGALLALLITCACGSPATRATPTPPVVEMRVLSSSAVPGIPSVTRVLTAGALANDASIPPLAANLRSWGYIDGRERTFQGESRHLMLVISRSLIFKDATGASDFVGFVQGNYGAYFGITTTLHPLVAQGRSGWLFAPPLCACHLANPAVIGILDAGSSVVWLEINGPDATPALLVNLLDPALSVPTTLPG